MGLLPLFRPARQHGLVTFSYVISGVRIDHYYIDKITFFRRYDLKFQIVV